MSDNQCICTAEGGRRADCPAPTHRGEWFSAPCARCGLTGPYEIRGLSRLWTQNGDMVCRDERLCNLRRDASANRSKMPGEAPATVWGEPQLVAVEQLADRLGSLGVADCDSAAMLLRGMVSERRKLPQVSGPSSGEVDLADWERQCRVAWSERDDAKREVKALHTQVATLRKLASLAKRLALGPTLTSGQDGHLTDAQASAAVLDVLREWATPRTAHVGAPWISVIKREQEVEALPWADEASARNYFDVAQQQWSDSWLCRVEIGPRDIGGMTHPPSVTCGKCGASLICSRSTCSATPGATVVAKAKAKLSGVVFDPAAKGFVAPDQCRECLWEYESPDTNHRVRVHTYKPGCLLLPNATCDERTTDLSHGIAYHCAEPRYPRHSTHTAAKADGSLYVWKVFPSPAWPQDHLDGAKDHLDPPPAGPSSEPAPSPDSSLVGHYFKFRGAPAMRFRAVGDTRCVMPEENNGRGARRWTPLSEIEECPAFPGEKPVPNAAGCGCVYSGDDVDRCAACQAVVDQIRTAPSSGTPRGHCYRRDNHGPSCWVQLGGDCDCRCNACVVARTPEEAKPAPYKHVNPVLEALAQQREMHQASLAGTYAKVPVETQARAEAFLDGEFIARQWAKGASGVALDVALGIADQLQWAAGEALRAHAARAEVQGAIDGAGEAAEMEMAKETRITVDCWYGRWKVLGLALTCLRSALSPNASVVVIKRH